MNVIEHGNGGVESKKKLTISSQVITKRRKNDIINTITNYLAFNYELQDAVRSNTRVSPVNIVKTKKRKQIVTDYLHFLQSVESDNDKLVTEELLVLMVGDDSIPITLWPKDSELHGIISFESELNKMSYVKDGIDPVFDMKKYQHIYFDKEGGEFFIFDENNNTKRKPIEYNELRHYVLKDSPITIKGLKKNG